MDSVGVLLTLTKMPAIVFTEKIELKSDQKSTAAQYVMQFHTNVTGWCSWLKYEFNIQWGTLQRTGFINKIRMLQRTEMLQRTRRNTIGRRSTRVRMTFSIITSTTETLFMLFQFTCTVYKS
jgi:hypothetical protein